MVKQRALIISQCLRFCLQSHTAKLKDTEVTSLLIRCKFETFFLSPILKLVQIGHCALQRILVITGDLQKIST